MMKRILRRWSPCPSVCLHSLTLHFMRLICIGNNAGQGGMGAPGWVLMNGSLNADAVAEHLHCAHPRFDIFSWHFSPIACDTPSQFWGKIKMHPIPIARFGGRGFFSVGVQRHRGMQALGDCHPCSQGIPHV